MRRWILGVLAFLALGQTAQSQFTSVSAIVKDPAGNVYASCRGNIDFVPSPTATQVPLLSGSTFQTSVPIASCDSFGAFSTILADNNQITDGHTGGVASQWHFSISSSTTPAVSFSVNLTITGATQNITAALQAASAPLPGTVVTTATNLVGPGSITGTFSGAHTETGNVTFQGTNSHSGAESFTGPVTTQAFNDILWVGSGGYATCQAAITAAGTVNKTIVAIRSSYAGAQCPANLFSTNPNVVIWDFSTAANNPPNTSPGIGTVFNFYDGNVLALDRSQFTVGVMPASASSAVVTGYWITTADGLTVGTGNTLDGISAEVNFGHTLTGTLPNATVAEHSITLLSSAVGGTITNARAVLPYVSTAAGSTTAITNAIGLDSRGCFTIAGTVPGHCIAVLAEDQGNKASIDNWALYGVGRNLIGYSSVTNEAGLWFEDHLNGRHQVLHVDSGDIFTVQAPTAGGMLLADSTGTTQARISATFGIEPFLLFQPHAVNTVDVGTAALPFRNLYLGTAANGFKFQPVATAALRTVNINDPGTASSSLGIDASNTYLPATNVFTGAWVCTNVTPVTVNANVATDQNVMACTIPAGTLNRVNRTLRVWAAGTYSTPAASASQMTVKFKLCTVSGCGSGTVITPINIQTTALGGIQVTNENWSCKAFLTTQTAGASSAYEAHGDVLMDLTNALGGADSAFGDTNNATVGTIDSTAQLFLQVTFAFSSASASNSATQRQLIIETVN